MQAGQPDLARWRRFLDGMNGLVAAPPAEPALLARAGALLGELVAQDDWLPDAFAAPDAARYQQHLLHLDPQARFSVVSFVWAPGQATPIHDHMVWGAVGMLRGSESSQRYVPALDGGLHAAGAAQVLAPGDVELLSPAEGDIHRVVNAHDGVSISIHVYGADIGRVRRRSFAPDGSARTFVSGYAQTATPTFWHDGSRR